MQSLKCLQHLLVLHIQIFISEFGLCLHFENGWFQKLKELYIENSLELRDIIIDKGALPSLKKLHLHALLGLENIPTGIRHLEKLEVLYISRMENEFVQHSSTTEDWNWIMEHVPFAEISTTDNRNVVRNSMS
jgi:disease resistance protein RPM1